MTIDLIVTWPDSLDYPIFRQFLHRAQGKFNKILIPIMPTNRPQSHNYTKFLKETAFADMPNVEFVEDYPVKTDWRNAAVNAALDRSTATWAWFTEQDFFALDHDDFFNKIIDGSKVSDLMVFRDGDRFHPACMFVTRELINKTSRDFGIVEGQKDHFGKFIDEAIDIMSVHPTRNQIVALTQLGLVKSRDFYHMDGLTHNYHLVEDGIKDTVYKPAEFIMYNSYARMAQVPQSEEFIKLTFKADLLLAPIVKMFLGGIQ